MDVVGSDARGEVRVTRETSGVSRAMMTLRLQQSTRRASATILPLPIDRPTVEAIGSHSMSMSMSTAVVVSCSERCRESSGQVRGGSLFRSGGAAETRLGGEKQPRGPESVRGDVRRLRPVSQGESNENGWCGGVVDGSWSTSGMFFYHLFLPLN